MTKPKRQTRRLPANLERAIAVAAQTDPRTVANVVAGRPTKASTRERIMRAMHERDVNEKINASPRRRAGGRGGSDESQA